MNIVCQTEALQNAVSTVSHAVSGKSTLPALEGVLLKARSSSLFLAGYDMEIGITTTMEAQIKEPGAIVLSVKLFGDIVRNLPYHTVSIETDEKLNVHIQCGMAEYEIMGIEADEYPEIPSVEDGVGFVIGRSTFKSMLRQTLFAVAMSESSRPVHKGVLFDVYDHQLTLVSLDGSRLALRKEPIESGEVMQFVMPRKTAAELLKLMDDEDVPTSLIVGKRHVAVEVGEHLVISRLLDGEFLPYRKAIPQQVLTTIKVNTRELMQSVARAAIVINDRVKSPIVCEFGGNVIKISCSTPLGAASDVTAADISGQEEEMGFNHQFLTDALKNVECDEVRIELNGALSPMKILPPEGDNFLFLVLPVRLPNSSKKGQ
ncbi:MAG: DNA polymerase III subunit beta [Clostridia bacterium]|nr:DNA polymerase III subunit beta [Clostridia bacterium]